MTRRQFTPPTEPEGLLVFNDDISTTRRVIAHLLALPDLTPERVAYLRGRRYRAELLASGRAVLREARRTVLKSAVRLLPFSKSDPRSRAADALAREYGTDRRTIRADCRYAAAADTIVLNCGEKALSVLLAGHPHLDRKTTEQISRTAPTRQRYEMELVSQGRRPLRGAAPVFDTVDFAEVISRLRRAQGRVRAALRVLRDPLVTTPLTAQDRSPITRNARVIVEWAEKLARLAGNAPEDQHDAGEPGTSEQRERAGSQQPAPAPLKDTGYRGVAGRLSNAGSFIYKSARDLPTLLNEVRPLRREKAEIETRLKGIISDCFAILRGIGEHSVKGVSPFVRRG